MAKETGYHHLHVRVDLPIWRKLREKFPEYGHVRKVVNLALAQFMDAWDKELRDEQLRRLEGNTDAHPD